MVILIVALLAGKPVLPQVDRNSLTIQARAEALQPSSSPRRAAVRQASTSPLDLASITTICRAAGDHSDPAQFIARISGAYSLSSDDNASLRASCVAYLAGRADARRN